MRPLEYTRPADIAEAVTLLTENPDASLLAGGTNLVDLMRLGVARPGTLIDISRLGLDEITPSPEGGIRIGAMVRNSDLAADQTIRDRFPMVARAVLAGASGQLRNMATTGGNLLQRTRCGYFTDVSKPCNKRDPGSGCPAITGRSRDLAVLGTSDACIATFPGDLPVALTALGAHVNFVDADGAGSVHIEDFYRLPGDDPRRDTTLPAGAIITSVDIPLLPFAQHSTYRKARDRRSFAFALGAVAVAVDLDGDVLRDTRIALGSVAPAPWRAHRAEAALRGTRVDLDSFRAASAAELSAARPTEQNAFKLPLFERLITGVLTELTGVSE